MHDSRPCRTIGCARTTGVETCSASLLEGLLDVFAVGIDEMLERAPDKRKGK